MAEDKMPLKWKPEDRVACSECSASVSGRNLSRHRKIMHGNVSTATGRYEDDNRSRQTTNVAEPPLSRSHSSSSDAKESCSSKADTGCLSTSSAANDCDQSVIPSSFLAEVACAVLDQHHQFTENQLIQYVADFYPEIPSTSRRALVIGAVSGAQQAAKLQFLFEKNKGSNDAAKREIAVNAGSSLSFWNMGLRQVSRSELTFRRPVATHDTSTTDLLQTSILNEQHKVASSLISLADIQLPVSFTQSNAQFNSMAAFDVFLEFENSGVAHNSGQISGPDSASLQDIPMLQHESLAMESNNTLRDALQSAGVLPEQPIEILTNITDTAEQLSDVSNIVRTVVCRGESELQLPPNQPVTEEQLNLPEAPTTTNNNSAQPAADQLQDQVNTDLPLCSRTASVEISRIDKDQAERARLPSEHFRQSASMETLSMPLVMVTSSQENLVIDLDAPSDLDIAVPTTTKDHRQHTTQTDVGVVKKTPSSVRRSENMSERQPVAKSQSSGLKSRVETVGEKSREYSSRSYRPARPRSRSRSSSPRRSNKKTERSPERMVLTGRQLEEYRRWMRRLKN